MALRIVPYFPEHEAAVAAFNARGQTNSAPFSLSKTALATWLPKAPDRTTYREYFLALDGETVRGGFTIRRQPSWLRGALSSVANYQGPLSEGIWDRRYMMAGVQMMRAAVRDHPLLYALGMGGVHQPLPKLLAAAGWQMAPLPFRFKVLRPFRFLRQIQSLRRTTLRARLLDLAAFSGVGSIGLHAVQAMRTKARLAEEYRSDVVSEYGDWADGIWEASRAGCALAGVRDRQTQNVLFGDGNPKNMILRCIRASRDIGWAVVRSTPMQDDRYFGNLRVGSLVDCLALPGEEAAVVMLATRHLRALSSDMIVTNQTHAVWLGALRASGYLAGPSNFIFACSPALAEQLGPLDRALGTIHVNRADGDGPIHL